MKCEQPTGCVTQDLMEIYEPGQLPESLQKKIEAFRFPLAEYPLVDEREKELEYDRMYMKRSVYVVHYSPFDRSALLAVARIIEKRSPADKLPVEFSTVLSSVDPSLEAVNGTLFSVDNYDDSFPVCEIGGLRAADIDPARGITLTTRYRAIDEVMKECDKQVHDRGYSSFFLTCIAAPHMERLYHDKFFFNEVATISFNGSPQPWKALWRTPFYNPVRKIAYSQKSIDRHTAFLPEHSGISIWSQFQDGSEALSKEIPELVG